MAAIFELESKLDDFDFDKLESGEAKDVLTDSISKPTSRGKLENAAVPMNESECWHQCYIERPEKGQYRMYDEQTGEMLLSSTRTKDGDYLISRYEDFPQQYAKQTMSTGAKMLASLSGTPQANSKPNQGINGRVPRYVAALRLSSARNGYKLYRNGCDLCDETLQKFNCTGCAPMVESEYLQDQSSANTFQPQPPTPSTRRNSRTGFASYGDDANRSQVGPKEDRQLLAVITQSMNVIEGTEIPARFMTLEVPGFLDCTDETSAERQRIVWCPRTLNNATKQETPAAVQRRLTHCGVRARRGSIVTDPAFATGGAAVAGRSRRMSTLFNEMVGEQERLKYKVRLPSWSSDIGSLVLTFHGNRVLEPSAKNFMMIDESTEAIDGGSDPRLVFQFGKVRRERFNLDFKYPLSPLQAFALALSSFKFTAK